MSGKSQTFEIKELTNNSDSRLVIFKTSLEFLMHEFQSVKFEINIPPDASEKMGTPLATWITNIDGFGSNIGDPSEPGITIFFGDLVWSTTPIYVTAESVGLNIFCPRSFDGEIKFQGIVTLVIAY